MTTFTPTEDINKKRHVLARHTHYSENEIERLAKTKSSMEIVNLVLKITGFGATGIITHTQPTFNFTPPLTGVNAVNIADIYPDSLKKDPYKEIPNFQTRMCYE